MKTRVAVMLIAMLVLMLATSLESTGTKPNLLKTISIGWKNLERVIYELPVIGEALRASLGKASESLVIHNAERLVKMTPEGRILPCLAESWEISEDMRKWTFHLKKGAEFFDGEPFTAQAVKANLEQILDPECAVPARFLISRVIKIEVLDDYTIRLTTDKPFRPLLAGLTYPQLAIYSPEAIKDCELRTLAGTGPFQLIKAEAKSPWTITLAKNRNYWGGPPALDKIVFHEVLEDATLEMMLRAGEIQVATDVPPQRAGDLYATSGVYVIDTTSIKSIYIGMNNLIEPFDNKLVRQAINHCVDKEQIVERIMFDYAPISHAPLSPVFGYDVGDYEYDPERARELLKVAGYPDGFETTLLFVDVSPYREIARLVQDNLQCCGVEVTLKAVPWPYLYERLIEGEYEMALGSWTPWIMDADYALFPVFHSSQIPPEGSNYSRYRSSLVDELLDEARTRFPDEERELYEMACSVIWEDAPWVFLYSPDIITGTRSNVRNLVVYPHGIIDVSEARIEEE